MTPQELANQCIAQGALTNSKRPSTFVEGVYPTHLTRGEECYVWDTNGKKYFDFICGLGTNILGYAQEDVNRAMISAMKDGASLSLSSSLELSVAQKIKTLFPFIDCMKFLKTGSEACSAAVRIARAKTGKKIIMSEGYHGWHEEFISLTKPHVGIPERWLKYRQDDSIVKLDDFYDSEEEFEDIAAIIIEPIMTDYSPKRIDWLRELRKKCTETGTLLIFDEVITGFRTPKFCMSNYLGIEPDIICLGKAIANGMPLSVVAGKKEIMNCDEYFVSSTFAGERLSLSSAFITINLLQGPFKLESLWQKGEEWLSEFNSMWPDMIRIEGYPTRGRFVGDEMIRALFFQEACKSGLLFGPSWFFNFPLSKKMDITLSACKDVICKIKSGNVRLEGKPPKSPFADKMRQKN